MKLVNAQIQNFRGLDLHKPLDFTDELGRVRDLILLVGPNSSGKTSILDALGAALGAAANFRSTSPLFQLSPRVVRTHQLYARVRCEVEFTDDEIAATRSIFELAEKPWDVPANPPRRVRLDWQYPAPKKQQWRGRVLCDPPYARQLFLGRSTVIDLLKTRRTEPIWFERIGAAFTFDQQRTGFGKTIPRDVWTALYGTEESPPTEARRAISLRDQLLTLAIQAEIRPRDTSGPTDEPFPRLRELYRQVCAPHKLIGAVRDGRDYDILFEDGKHQQYGFDGLSSGEQMVLLFLVRMAIDNIHRSVLLVDELELHQHPAWQSKLLHQLPRMGQGNQVLATTHSPYLRDVAPRGAVVDLGALGDGAVEVA